MAQGGEVGAVLGGWEEEEMVKECRNAVLVLAKNEHCQITQRSMLVLATDRDA